MEAITRTYSFDDLVVALPHYSKSGIRKRLAALGVQRARGNKRLTFTKQTFDKIIESFVSPSAPIALIENIDIGRNLWRSTAKRFKHPLHLAIERVRAEMRATGKIR